LLVVEARRRAPEDEGKGEIRFGLTATRKIGSAVVRNRARRRLREAGRRLLPDLGAAGTDYVLIARTGAATASSARLLDDLRSALLSVRAALAGGSRGSRRSGHPSASRQPDQSVPRDESTDA
jgi:ribonuclease P protein component